MLSIAISRSGKTFSVAMSHIFAFTASESLLQSGACLKNARVVEQTIMSAFAVLEYLAHDGASQWVLAHQVSDCL